MLLQVRLVSNKLVQNIAVFAITFNDKNNPTTFAPTQ